MPAKLIPVVPEYANDLSAQAVWASVVDWLGNADAVAFYMHPNMGTGDGILPDFAVLSRTHGAITIKVVRSDLSDLAFENEELVLHSGVAPSWPLLDLEDLRVALQYRFATDRRLRGTFPVHSILACPRLTSGQFNTQFPKIAKPPFAIWRDTDANSLPASGTPLSEPMWRLAQSVFQSASILNRPASPTVAKPTTLGDAIRVLEQDIALLDEQQTKVALQIVDGPQRVRGLAGTGKTVLLALKAATVHSHYPEARLLFTFNTQSLYNQARDLITRFYRINKQSDPDWNRVEIRHAWGGQRRPGVYSDICTRQGSRSLDFRVAKAANPKEPFQACCADVLSRPIESYYDYVFVDEAQDFPKDFFRVLYHLAAPPKRIYFAFDELQSLAATEIPTALDLFGVDALGTPLVDLDGEYPGGAEKDLVLSKSYRCPGEILMLAHGIGLGIHSSRGCVQMISQLSTWQAIGYELEAGNFTTGTTVTIARPPHNSPNRLREIYCGTSPLVRRSHFDTRDAELDWVVKEIVNDIKIERVEPSHIMVISLDSLNAKRYMGQIQTGLLSHGIASVIPGLVDAADEFAESGKVTLSTVFRAKGNEAPVVYIVAFEAMYDYIEELDMRNRAFTAISRAKGWVRISGKSPRMIEAVREIDAVLQDVPKFRFVFPDMARIQRNLDATETTRRRKEVKLTHTSIRQLAEVDPRALSAIPPEELENLLKKLEQLKERRGVDN